MACTRTPYIIVLFIWSYCVRTDPAPVARIHQLCIGRSHGTDYGSCCWQRRRCCSSVVQGKQPPPETHSTTMHAHVFDPMRFRWPQDRDSTNQFMVAVRPSTVLNKVCPSPCNMLSSSNTCMHVLYTLQHIL